MPAPLAPRVRAAILRDIRAGMARNAIARKHAVAASTVGKIAAAEGMADTAFDRTHTLKGARAKAADNRARRAQLVSDLLDDAQKLRVRIWSPYDVAVGTKDGAAIITLALPPLPDARAGYTAIAQNLKAGLDVEKHDNDDGQGAAVARSVLEGVFDALVAKHGTS